jgi:hypothetical protein
VYIGRYPVDILYGSSYQASSSLVHIISPHRSTNLIQLPPTMPPTTTSTTNSPPQPPPRRLLIFQEARNPQNPSELVYLPVNKQGLPITGPGPELPSILELPLRILKAFTEIFNTPKYSGW